MIALIFVVAVGLIMVAIVNLAGVNILNTANLQGERTLEYSADGAVEAAVQFVRYDTPDQTNDFCGQGNKAFNAPAPIDGVNVYCQVAEPAYQRVLTLVACPPQVGSCGLMDTSQAVLTATVAISDVSSGCTTGFGPGCYDPSGGAGSTSGNSVTVESWVVNKANG